VHHDAIPPEEDEKEEEGDNDKGEKADKLK
jgi:hypothetical protein